MAVTSIVTFSAHIIWPIKAFNSQILPKQKLQLKIATHGSYSTSTSYDSKKSSFYLHRNHKKRTFY